MYYVVKLYDYAKPLVMEAFKSLECAKLYCNALIKDGSCLCTLIYKPEDCTGNQFRFISLVTT